ncbi:MAG TPA: hypothetical protein VHM20_04265 [Gammaproteobacteria bacterium]|jgi:hypothetical protein|nr:hypothetical protein [Gammaproteobacteria bacterium]
MKIKKYHGIEIEEGADNINPYYFYFRRSGIVILLLFLFVAFLGVFGSGFLNKHSITNNFFTVRYDKFLKLQSTSIYQIKIHYPNMCVHNQLQFWIHADFFKGMSIKEMNPKPNSEVIMQDKILFTFDCDPMITLAVVNIVVEPEIFGFHASQIGIGTNIINLSQLIYP